MSFPNLFPGWEIIEKIGSGGFSTVYKIKKIDGAGSGDFYAALKIVSIPNSPDEYDNYLQDGYDEDTISGIFTQQVKKLEDEFHLMARFKGYTNIVSYEDHMIIPHSDGKGWDILIRMELLEPLTKYFASRVMHEAEIIKLGIDICRALELCQKSNIIHRDIKPQNIFVNEFGDFKLGDFGIARTMDHTTHATKIGTFTYISPEVYRGEAYNQTVDIYSLGLVLYWLLNERRLPFLPLPPAAPTANQISEAIGRRMSGEGIPAPKNGSDELKQIVLKACAFNPEDRFSNPSEMRKALERVEDNITPVVVPTNKGVQGEPNKVGNQNFSEKSPLNQTTSTNDMYREMPVSPVDPTTPISPLNQNMKPNVFFSNDSVSSVEKTIPVSAFGRNTPDFNSQNRNGSLGGKPNSFDVKSQNVSGVDNKTPKSKKKKSKIVPILIIVILIIIAIVLFLLKGCSGEGTSNDSSEISSEISNDISENSKNESNNKFGNEDSSSKEDASSNDESLDNSLDDSYDNFFVEESNYDFSGEMEASSNEESNEMPEDSSGEASDNDFSSEEKLPSVLSLSASSGNVELLPTEISLNKTSLTMTNGDTASLTASLTYGTATKTFTATVTPSDAGDASVTATSSNTSVATVTTSISENVTTITITAKNSGNATITVKANGNTYISKTYVLTVTKNQIVTWTSSSTSIATVSTGTVTAKSAGNATITAKTSNSKSVTCSVKVESNGVQVGDTITFGTYEQDNVTSNGAEAIEWEVLEVKDGKALIISKYALDAKPYNEKLENVTWATCTLRSWLNNDFYNTAFSSSEKSKIKSTTLTNADNPYDGTEGGNNTVDEVFLLSIDEAIKYYIPDKVGEKLTSWISTNGAAECEATAYAKANGAYVDSSNKCTWWWLRSPGMHQHDAAEVLSGGAVLTPGDHVSSDNIAVRPALWISLES